MKSGKKEMKFNFKIKWSDYVDGHSKKNCKGAFRIGFSTNVFYTSSALGPVKLPCIPQIMCHECGTAYTVPGFEDWIEEIIAYNFVLSKESLNKKQIKFLRQFFGFTQEDLSEKIGLSGGKAELSKMESESSTRNMGSDTQVRMKILFAKLLKVKDIESVFMINELDDTKTVKLDSSWFPVESDLKKIIKTG